MISTLRFVSLGYGHVVCANRIYCVVRVDTAQNRRILKCAKTEGRFMDWSAHKKIKSLILLDDATVIGSFFSVATIFSRLNKACGYDVTKDTKLMEEDEVED